MKITFEGATLLDLANQITDFISELNEIAITLREPLEDKPDATTKSTRRKSKAKAADAEPKEPEPKEPAEEPAKASRRRGKKAAPASEEPKKASRRRGSKTASKSESTPDGDNGISASDLAKAASLGAEALTPKGVTAILNEFGVNHTDELADENKREFLDRIEAAIAEAKE